MAGSIIVASVGIVEFADIRQISIDKAAYGGDVFLPLPIIVERAVFT